MAKIPIFNKKLSQDMVIEKCENSQLLAEIWLEVSLSAHDFVAGEYWKENYEKMKDLYLPATDNYVAKAADESVAGFISIHDGHIHAIFVRNQTQGRGIGHSLVEFAKRKYPKLSLTVYEKNVRARSFYTKEGFRETGRGIDAATGEAEIFMEYISP